MEMIIGLIIYWLKCIFEPAYCQFERNILYLWSLWGKLNGKAIGG